jgi:hypothetical protein
MAQVQKQALSNMDFSHSLGPSKVCNGIRLICHCILDVANNLLLLTFSPLKTSKTIKANQLTWFGNGSTLTNPLSRKVPQTQNQRLFRMCGQYHIILDMVEI